MVTADLSMVKESSGITMESLSQTMEKAGTTLKGSHPILAKSPCVGNKQGHAEESGNRVSKKSETLPKQRFPRSQVALGNALVSAKLCFVSYASFFPTAAKQSFARRVRSQVQFGNEGKGGNRVSLKNQRPPKPEFKNRGKTLCSFTHEGNVRRSLVGYPRGHRQHSRSQSPHDPTGHALPVFSSQITFPHANDLPAELAQRARHQPVARDVLLELPQPEIEPAFRHISKPAARMSMPETAIHKHRHALLWKNKIRPAKHRAPVAPPAGDLVLAKKRHKAQLRILVPAAANARHHLRALLRRENIRHSRAFVDLLKSRR